MEFDSNVKKANIPWVEKYRPIDFTDIVLSDINKRIFSNVLKTCDFPNVIFYGPPGTGKTTTIINLVKKYHENLKQKHSPLTIHLNASDDRGIDVVRNKIQEFVQTKQLFFPGMKFVILDEVDYMTEFAQQALRSLIQTTTTIQVRFCLICNYIGKINESLQNDFIKIQFNNLPAPSVFAFLKNISVCENLKVSDCVLENIQDQFKSDIRSMINLMQTYQNYSLKDFETKIINSRIYISLFQQICSIPNDKLTNNSLNVISKQIKKYSTTYNINESCIIKKMVKYIIWKERHNPKCSEFMNFAETLFHNKNACKYTNKIILEIHRFGSDNQV